MDVEVLFSSNPIGMAQSDRFSFVQANRTPNPTALGLSQTLRGDTQGTADTQFDGASIGRCAAQGPTPLRALALRGSWTPMDNFV